MKLSDFFSKKQVAETRQRARTSIIVDDSQGKPASDRLIDIFTGDDREYDLAVGSVNKQILTTAKLIGVPHIINEGHEWLESLITDEAEIVHKMALVAGTHWLIPRWEKGVKLEHIKDSEIGVDNLRVNPESGELDAVYQKYEYRYPTGEFEPSIRLDHVCRSWTKDFVYKKMFGIEKIEENLLSILPTPFAVNSIGGLRGVSAYAGILRIVRNIHKLRYNRDSILSNIRPKLKVGSQDVDSFISSNAVMNGQNVFDPYNADFIGMLTDETAEFVTLPSSIFDDINKAIDDNQKELLTAGLLPEMFSGRALVGNYASAEYNVIQGVEYIKSLRRELDKAWGKILNECAKLYAFKTSTKYEPIRHTWDAFDMMTATNKSVVMSQIVSAMATLTQAGLPIELVFDMVKQLNPMLDYETADEFQDAFFKTKTNTPTGDFDWS